MSEAARAETMAAGWNGPGSGTAWLTLVAAVLGGVMVGLDGTATTVAAPDLAASVGASLGELELIANAYLVALAVALLPAGVLADRVGRRRTFVLGVLGFALSSLAVALSGSVATLVLFRVVQGLSGALLQPAGLALVRGAFGAGGLGLPLGGVLAQRFGSRGPVAAGLVAVAAGLAAMSGLGTDAEFAAVLYPGALIGLGTGLCLIAATEAIMAAAPDESAGSASAVQQVASQFGGVLGIATLASVLALSVPGGLANAASHAGPGFLDGMRAGLLLAAALTIAAAPAAMVLPRQSSRVSVSP